MDHWDIALLKETRFTESKILEFRMETFDTFIHAQFFGPNPVDGNINDGDQRHVSALAAGAGAIALIFRFRSKSLE